jgi:outer membrane protein OmpA-like peptidoglycan-associated protein
MPNFNIVSIFHSLKLFRTNMRTLMILAFALMISVSVSAQDTGLPPNPEPGKCYVRCVSPDEWGTEEVQVLKRPGYTQLEVVPAEYKTVEERILIKPATKKFVYVPAEFKTVTEQVQVEDAYNEVTVKAAAFAPGTKEVETQAAYSSYEYQRAMSNCQSEDPRDCMVLCYVEHPAQTATVAIETLTADASYTAARKGGNTITITKQELVSAARVEEVEIPAEYRTITKQVLVKDETVREVKVDPVYVTETRRVLKKAGGISVWEEIDCELTSLNVLPVFYELGSARLTSDSRRIIDEKLLALMQAKPLIKIEINSHTDSRGSASSNLSLSQSRAQAVVDYLAGKGISRSRLVAKGYGETRLVNGCKDGVTCSEADHQKNRRTEFRVISE